ncbi:MAG TPA: hypothetical protein VFN64_11480, partial [Burkholderiaceae bacterium]|nr:hypothetical protein [Burkholderiaceae bacterium]
MSIPSATTEVRGGGVESLILGIRENHHAKVLVVGHRGDNFPEPYRSHPQLLFWELPEVKARAIPQAVKLVIVTRFISHPAFEQLAAECRRRGIRLYSRLLGTGAAKVLLEPLVGREASREADWAAVTAAPAADPSAAATINNNEGVMRQRQWKRGELSAFVQEHGRLDGLAFGRRTG